MRNFCGTGIYISARCASSKAYNRRRIISTLQSIKHINNAISETDSEKNYSKVKDLIEKHAWKDTE